MTDIQRRPATIFVDRPTRGILDLCEIDGEYWITRINVPVKNRSKGVGTKLLTEALADADLAHVAVRLLADPSGGPEGMQRADLVRWYGKFGFEQIEGESYGFLLRAAR